MTGTFRRFVGCVFHHPFHKCSLFVVSQSTLLGHLVRVVPPAQTQAITAMYPDRIVKVKRVPCGTLTTNDVALFETSDYIGNHAPTTIAA